MTPRRRMSENEKKYFIAFLFPPLWPLGIAMLLCAAASGVANGTCLLWHRVKSRFRRPNGESAGAVPEEPNG